MKNNQIKENLFSFKTFRSPDRTGEADKLPLFVHSTNPQD